MNEFLSILSQPITQLGGIVGIMVLLQKRGIDIGGIIRSFLGIRDADTAKETDATTRDVLQTMVFQMSELSNHFNHETTGQLEGLTAKVDELRDGIKDMNRTLQEILKYGINCRKD